MIEQKEYFDYQKISAAIDTYIQAHLDNDSFSGSILVAHRGEIISIQGYGMANLEHQIPNTPQTKFRLGSITKQFTATAILKLQEQGLLDVNKSVATYLPKYPHGKRITVHHLLNHTAGIPNYTNFPVFPKNKRLETTLDDLIAGFNKKPLKFRHFNPNEEVTAKKYLLIQLQNWFDNLLRRKPPGDNFNYSNSGYVVLTKIIETLSHQSYE
ncbi:MAG: serine hydrolase domain-containing protein, partial [Cyanobacteria bacterium P01_C01_bin.72]